MSRKILELFIHVRYTSYVIHYNENPDLPQWPNLRENNYSVLIISIKNYYQLKLLLTLCKL